MQGHSYTPQLRRIRDATLLDVNDAMIAGRHSSCPISLSREEGASRKHARFNITDGKLTVTDLGSLNGTFVNGHEIDGRHALNDGDIIIFDIEKYEVVLPKPADITTASSTANTVIANKAERENPAIIKPAIKVLDQQEPAAISPIYNNTEEYLHSLPQPDLKRPVDMPIANRHPKSTQWVIALLAAIVIVLTLILLFQSGAITGA